MCVLRTCEIELRVNLVAGLKRAFRERSAGGPPAYRLQNSQRKIKQRPRKRGQERNELANVNPRKARIYSSLVIPVNSG